MATGELRTNDVVKDILASGELWPKVMLMVGKTLYTPYLPPPAPGSSSTKAEMKMLRLYSEEDLSRCPLDKWGILDPGTLRREVGKEQEAREDGMSSPWLIS
jgi:5-formyltetrahydrofolate cyclo-ligase